MTRHEWGVGMKETWSKMRRYEREKVSYIVNGWIGKETGLIEKSSRRNLSPDWLIDRWKKEGVGNTSILLKERVGVDFSVEEKVGRNERRKARKSATKYFPFSSKTLLTNFSSPFISHTFPGLDSLMNFKRRPLLLHSLLLRRRAMNWNWCVCFSTKSSILLWWLNFSHSILLPRTTHLSHTRSFTRSFSFIHWRVVIVVSLSVLSRLPRESSFTDRTRRARIDSRLPSNARLFSILSCVIEFKFDYEYLEWTACCLQVTHVHWVSFSHSLTTAFLSSYVSLLPSFGFLTHRYHLGGRKLEKRHKTAERRCPWSVRFSLSRVSFSLFPRSWVQTGINGKRDEEEDRVED